MKRICICFQVHHPFHFQTYRFLDIGSNKSYYDDQRIEREIYEAATNYYLPSNELLLKLINEFEERFKVAFYISGTAIDQFLMYQPDVLNSFRQLADTGQVEFLGGTSSHSLISLTNLKAELIHQLKDYQSKIAHHFGYHPRVFVNSDLIYSDLIGKDVAEAGYRAIMTNGTKKALNWLSPNYVYSNCIKPRMHVYFRNELFSDELARHLNSLDSDENEVNSKSFLSSIDNLSQNEPLLNIYLDYKTIGGFGISKKEKFFRTLISQIDRKLDMSFIFPSEIAEQYGSVAEINANEPICWVNKFHSYYYPGNDLQTEAIKQLYTLEKIISKVDNRNLHSDWQYLQTSDHIHLMDDQHPSYRGDGIDNSIYKTKYDAFINFMNILEDLILKIHKESNKKQKKHSQNHIQNRMDS